MMLDLFVATTNPGKLRELRILLGGLPLRVLGASDLSTNLPPVVEDGATFEENALKKAKEWAAFSGLPTLADDTGLEVDLLGGAPGVHSARYAGDHATDTERMEKLLREIEKAKTTLREQGSKEGPVSARFRCVLALWDPAANLANASLLVQGTCEGRIVTAPRGNQGFGYDPVFEVESTGKTLAEMSTEEKNAVSHRGRALMALRPHLASLVRRTP